MTLTIEELVAAGTLAESLGNWEAAERALLGAVELAKPTDDTFYAARYDALHALGVLYGRMGRDAQAVPLLEEALRERENGIAQGSLNPDSPRALIPLVAFSSSLRRCGGELNDEQTKQGESAERMLWSSVAGMVKAKVGGAGTLARWLLSVADHPPRADGWLEEELVAAGSALLESRENAPADEAWRYIAEIRGVLRGEESEGVAQAWNNAGVACVQDKRLAQADACYRRSLSLAEKVLGPANPILISLLDNLATLSAMQDRMEEADGFFQRSLAVATQAAVDAAHLASRLENLGMLCEVRGDAAGAQRCFGESIARIEESHGPGHVALVSCLGNAGEHARAIDILKATDPSLSMGEIADSMAQLGIRATKTNNIGRGKGYFAIALTAAELALGKEHPHVAEILTDYALTWGALCGEQQAAPLRARAKSITGA
jgi:tetratricopeptide (TPR) repeat protein